MAARSGTVTRPFAPDQVLSAAHARAKARREQDWPEADRLKREIEAAGWKVIDRGTDFALESARAADEQRDGRLVYGASANVPSRLGEPSTAPATIVVVPDDATDGRAVAEALTASARDGTQIVVCLVDGASVGPVVPPTETVWMRAGSGTAARVNAGIRRASGSTVVVVAGAVQIHGDIVGPLEQALADSEVAVAGGWGRTSADGRTVTDTGGPAPIIDLACVAFRRDDIAAIGLLDESYHGEPHVAAWLSLALRLGRSGLDAIAGTAPPDGPGRTLVVRRAVVIDLPAERPPSAIDPDARRRDRRDHYRLRDAFGGHLTELLATDP